MERDVFYAVIGVCLVLIIAVVVALSGARDIRDAYYPQPSGWDDPLPKQPGEYLNFGEGWLEPEWAYDRADSNLSLAEEMLITGAVPIAPFLREEASLFTRHDRIEYACVMQQPLSEEFTALLPLRIISSTLVMGFRVERRGTDQGRRLVNVERLEGDYTIDIPEHQKKRASIRQLFELEAGSMLLFGVGPDGRIGAVKITRLR